MNFGRRSSIITCATPARDVKDWSFSNECNEPDSKSIVVLILIGHGQHTNLRRNVPEKGFRN